MFLGSLIDISDNRIRQFFVDPILQRMHRVDFGSFNVIPTYNQCQPTGYKRDRIKIFKFLEGLPLATTTPIMHPERQNSIPIEAHSVVTLISYNRSVDITWMQALK